MLASDSYNLGFNISQEFKNIANNKGIFGIKNKSSYSISIFVEDKTDIDFWKAIFSHYVKQFSNVEVTYHSAGDLQEKDTGISGDGCSRLYSLIFNNKLPIGPDTLICVDSDFCCYCEETINAFQFWCQQMGKDIPIHLNGINYNDYIFTTVAYSRENIQFDLNVMKVWHDLTKMETELIEEFYNFLEDKRDLFFASDREKYYEWLSKSSMWLKAKCFNDIPETVDNPNIITTNQNSTLKIIHLIRGHNLKAVIFSILKELQSRKCSDYMRKEVIDSNDINIKKSVPEDYLPKTIEKLNTILGSNNEVHKKLPIYATIEKLNNLLNNYSNIS